MCCQHLWFVKAQTAGKVSCLTRVSGRAPRVCRHAIIRLWRTGRWLSSRVWGASLFNWSSTQSPHILLFFLNPQSSEAFQGYSSGETGENEICGRCCTIIRINIYLVFYAAYIYGICKQRECGDSRAQSQRCRLLRPHSVIRRSPFGMHPRSRWCMCVLNRREMNRSLTTCIPPVYLEDNLGKLSYSLK